MTHTYKLTRFSHNKKTGGIPTSITSMSSCPSRCTLKNDGCYADIGPLLMHWRKVAETGHDIDTFCRNIRTLPKRILWRHNQAGDLPGDGSWLHRPSIRKIVDANKDRFGFTYTHYDPRSKHNARIIKYANTNGFTINLSADCIEEADEYKALNIGPVVTVLPIDAVDNFITPAGNTVVICPAAVGNTTCAQCELCQVVKRKSIVGFPAHGIRKNHAQKVFWAKSTQSVELAI